MSPEQKEEQKNSTKRKIARIEIKRADCIGAASCIAVAPKAYTLDEENIAVVQREWIEHSDEEILLSAQACPTMAIYVYDEEGNVLWPKEEE